MADRCESQAPAGDLLLRWRVHPARSRPVAAAVALLFIIGVSGLVQSAWQTGWLTALAVLLLGGAAGEFLFPSVFCLTTDGAERRAWTGLRQQVAWADVQVVYRFDDGLKLSTLPRPGPLEPHRGLFLRWGEQRDFVLAIVDQRATARRRPAKGDDEREPDGS